MRSAREVWRCHMLSFGDTWTCATATCDGWPRLIRCRTNVADIADGMSLPRLLRITWKFPVADASGLPSAELNETMAEFENAVVAELELDSTAIFVSVLVCNGVKEWNAYIADAQRVCDRLNRALASHRPFPVELTVEDDPGWQTYRKLVKSLNTTRDLPTP
jgi:hypothetical protein